jgi:ribonuclease G
MSDGARPSETLFIHHSPHETRVALQQGADVVELQVERTAGRGLSGNIYRGRVARVIPSMDAAFVDIGLERAALLHAADVWQPNLPEGAQPSITDLLRPGQQVMVQVVREPAAKKGPRVTMQVSLPGRNVVLLTRDPQFGVSKMIVDAAERERLLTAVQRVAPPGCGAIVRTVGEGATDVELADDMRLLAAQWADVQARFEASSGPSFIFDDLDLVLRALRDLVGPQTDTVWLDDAGEEMRVSRYIQRFHPDARPQVRLHAGPTPLFQAHGLDKAARQAVEPRVRLRSGGELVIQRTEAMTVIDVNSGRQVGAETLAESVLALNLEAAHAVALQLRLRNIGGLVIIDFVDMARADDRRALEQAFAVSLARDRARIRLGKLSEFGTIQLTRKRVRESIYERTTESCATCRGRGFVRAASDLAIETLERLRPALAVTSGDAVVRVQVPTRVAAVLRDQLAGAVRDLEREFSVTIMVQDDARLTQAFVESTHEITASSG